MFVCNICNKEFKTYQKLGGHKSSHNRKKKSILVITDNNQTHKRKGHNQFTKAKRLGLPKPEVSIPTRKKYRLYVKVRPKVQNYVRNDEYQCKLQ